VGEDDVKGAPPAGALPAVRIVLLGAGSYSPLGRTRPPRRAAARVALARGGDVEWRVPAPHLVAERGLEQSPCSSTYASTAAVVAKSADASPAHCVSVGSDSTARSYVSWTPSTWRSAWGHRPPRPDLLRREGHDVRELIDEPLRLSHSTSIIGETRQTSSSARTTGRLVAPGPGFERTLRDMWRVRCALPPRFREETRRGRCPQQSLLRRLRGA
jgi:hypothetical protein